MKRALGYRSSDTPKLLRITQKEKRFLYIKTILVVLILDYFFFQSLLALLPLSYIGLKYFQLEKRLLVEKKREQVREQFKELLLLVSKGQKAGYSADNAFLSAYPEMQELYGAESSICEMLQMIRTAKENRKPLPEVWHRIGEITEIREITEFAGVYGISHEKSGNVAGVMEKTAEIIASKIETEKEIAVLFSAKRLEQRIMNVMPFFIMFYMAVTSPGYFDGLYHTSVGLVIMSVCLGIYLAAYRVSWKIADIRL
ncbi:MAG: hypothetical protein IJ409_02420 [Lachnospiraceae bacterium]|nr:hypothetical protein [Lachnospiraceae bacterium]